MDGGFSYEHIAVPTFMPQQPLIAQASRAKIHRFSHALSYSIKGTAGLFIFLLFPGTQSLL